MDETKDSNNTK